MGDMMDGPTDALLRELLSVAAAVAERRAAKLVAEAQAEAEADVKALVKSSLTAALLQRAAPELAGDANDAPAPASQTAPQIGSERDCDPQLLGHYLYAITRGDAVGGWPTDDSTAAGIDPRFPLKLVAHEDLRAIVSHVPLDGFGTREQLQDFDWIEQKVQAHDRIIKSVARTGPAIPLRFCTVIRQEADVRELLATHQTSLLDVLGALEGKQEWGVKILLRPRDPDAGEGERTSPQHEVGEGAGKAYLLRRRRARAREGGGRPVSEEVAHCHAEMLAAAADAVTLPLRRSDVRRKRDKRDKAGADDADDIEMVFNAAYLVADDDVEAFRATVAALESRYQSQGLHIELSGPWPPYNFVRLDLSGGPAAQQQQQTAGEGGRS
jgi:hypothetical protein